MDSRCLLQSSAYTRLVNYQNIVLHNLKHLLRNLSNSFGFENRAYFRNYLIKRYGQNKRVHRVLIGFFLKSKFSFETKAPPSSFHSTRLVTSSSDLNHIEIGADPKIDCKRRTIVVVLPEFNNNNFNRVTVLRNSADSLRMFGFDIKYLQNDSFKSSDIQYLSKQECIFLLDSEYTPEEIEKIFFVITAVDHFKQFKFGMIVYDLWRRRDKEMILRTQRYFDFLFHMDHIKVDSDYFFMKSKFYFLPICHTSFEFLGKDLYPANRDQKIFFSGRIMADRLGILNEVLKVLPKTRFTGDFNLSDASSIPLSNSEYVKKLLSSEISLSLTQRMSNHWIIPGRSIEILLSQSLLIHQEGPNCKPLSKYLTPFEDYLPFTNQRELKELLLFCSSHPREVKKISQRGSQRAKELIQSLLFSRPFLV